MTHDVARVALITGAASGLGLACAERLALDGLHLHLVDHDGDLLSSVGSSLATSASTSAADIRTRGACEEAVAACLDRHGRLDVVVNSAGIYPRAPILEITEADWRRLLDVNVLGTYFMTVAAVPPMRERGGGRVVNVASVDAFVAHPDNAHYAATKAAVVSLTRSLAKALAPDGILVNSVAPGPMATGRAKESDWYDDMVAALPTGMPIEPAEVANLVAFLASDANVSITGENVIISGGGTIA